ncbi:MAG: polysaccharide deacetylase family protein [Candidatus Omnitrophica bacterium]|nr:polysaccharide deacetylase family protein [Candidatus Omnitrophota bacterium]
MNRWSYYLPILGYHRVGSFKGDHVPTVSAEAFERQLTFLARRRYRVLSLQELIEALDRWPAVPRRSVVITFDDGYEETHTVARPLLKRFGFPAIVFITPAEVGLPGFATWEQVAEMARDGLSIGSHTMHHAYLPLVREDRLAEEVIESKRVIEQRLGGYPVRCLSYPVGGFTPKAQALAREAGYQVACTTNRARTLNALDRLALLRIKVTERDAHPLALWAKASGYYNTFRQLKPPS